MYRPQFAYATPPGCRDEDFVYFFDGSTVPLLNQNITGLTVENIPLPLEQDAPFYWRGWKFGAVRTAAAGCPPVFSGIYDFPDVDVRLRDCYRNDLQDNWVPAVQGGFAMNPLQFNHALLTGPPVPLEPEIYCPPGGTLWLFLKGNSNGGYPSISFYGVKRFKDCKS